MEDVGMIFVLRFLLNSNGNGKLVIVFLMEIIIKIENVF